VSVPDVPADRPRQDGDGWVRCDLGHKHWGLHGAAGLLVRAPDDTGAETFLLQRRAWWTHHGDTWGVPGGARMSTETPEQTAVREIGEEVVIDLSGVTIDRVHTDDHGGWTYWTVLGSAPLVIPAYGQSRETAEVRWVRRDAVRTLPLHPGFAATWPRL
jgi:8-oxo-dGTP pyrophosphatase MutT (NUDIX family)